MQLSGKKKVDGGKLGELSNPLVDCAWEFDLKHDRPAVLDDLSLADECGHPPHLLVLPGTVVPLNLSTVERPKLGLDAVVSALVVHEDHERAHGQGIGPRRRHLLDLLDDLEPQQQIALCQRTTIHRPNGDRLHGLVQYRRLAFVGTLLNW